MNEYQNENPSLEVIKQTLDEKDILIEKLSEENRELVTKLYETNEVNSEREIDELKEYIISLRQTVIEGEQIIEKLNENNTILTQKLYEEIENQELARSTKGTIPFLTKNRLYEQFQQWRLHRQ